jgi:hypothetical protein
MEQSRKCEVIRKMHRKLLRSLDATFSTGSSRLMLRIVRKLPCLQLASKEPVLAETSTETTDYSSTETISTSQALGFIFEMSSKAGGNRFIGRVIQGKF